MIPPVWHFALLALCAYRVWRLIAEDEILERPRRFVLRLGDEWAEDGDPVPDGYREKWALFLTCPWCAGAWISGLVYLAWLWLYGDPDHPSNVLTGVAVWFALSATVGIIRRQLDPPEE